jgi:hypothetical protein
MRAILVVALVLTAGCAASSSNQFWLGSVGCRPNRNLSACRDSLASLRADLQCLARAIPDSSWYHVLGTTYATYLPCGIAYWDRTSGIVTVVRR